MIIKNAAILLLTGKKFNRILLLKHRKLNKWMLPGGMLDKSDKNPFYGMKREFKEETGCNLPKLIEPIYSYIYNDHTKIYIARTKDKIGQFIPNNEASDMKNVKIEDLSLSNNKYKLRNSVKKSFEKINKKINLELLTLIE